MRQRRKRHQRGINWQRSATLATFLFADPLWESRGHVIVDGLLRSLSDLMDEHKFTPYDAPMRAFFCADNGRPRDWRYPRG